MRNILIAIVVLILVGGGVYAYTRQFKTPVQTPTTPATQTSPSVAQVSTAMSPASGTPTAEPSVATTGGGAMEAKTFTVTGTEFAFSPSTLTVKKGETVKITFKNAGQYPHNLTIGGLNAASKTIQAGQSDTFEFTADQPGSFSFTCTVDSHAEKGMKGTLTVQ